MKHTEGVFRSLLLLTATIAALTLSACSAQQMFGGPPKPKAEIAIIRGWGVDIISVNGSPVGVGSAGVVVLPGINNVVVRDNAANYNDLGDQNRVYAVPVLTGPGIEYAITSKRGSPNVCAYPLDPASGEPMFDRPSGCFAQKP